MRRINLWALSTLSALALLLGYHTSTSGATAVSGTQPPYAASAGSDASGATSGSSGTTTSGGPAGGAGKGSTGSGSGSSGAATTVTGSVAQTRWGPVQVQLTVAGRKITQVDVVQYPNGNGTDQQINSYALPILTQETVDAQSAQIDMVSGATVTSDGYMQSLQSALDQAGL